MRYGVGVRCGVAALCKRPTLSRIQPLSHASKSFGRDSSPYTGEPRTALHFPTAGRTRILSVICCRKATANASSPYFKGSQVPATDSAAAGAEWVRRRFTWWEPRVALRRLGARLYCAAPRTNFPLLRHPKAFPVRQKTINPPKGDCIYTITKGSNSYVNIRSRYKLGR